ncbi:Di-copper centre-containing protein [Viridothelium virens]|uniref:tyrosinase n=1 Tax=Viridothelium virens TaxID=1048519 RepID=A0A6A6HPD6_VIRVR|nr:Di-copper centre-containing protein [Viridothelium virens]
MRASTFLLYLTTLIPSIIATPIADWPNENEALNVLEERASTFAITGVPGNVYPRLEVRQMASQQPNQFTLLLLGMQQFMAQPQANQLSYYQIAGIHGVPRVNWDGVGQCASCSGTDGYCTHNSVLFPAWHRAYMALFEQEFMAAVNTIAASFTNAAQKSAMQAAASTMRFPYWDWAAIPPSGGPNLPAIVSNKYVNVTNPNGAVTQIINPLFRHDFQSTSDLVYSPFVTWNVTLRYPSSNTPTAFSVEANATAAFDNIRSSLQDQIYQMFSTCTDYLHFSNDDAGSSTTTCSNSLEAIHNTVHDVAGGGTSTTSGGHMTYLSEASFDPIFWLHHMNVDRFFALWQAIHPNSYGASQVASGATWTIAQGSTQNANSPLTPFHRDTTGDFWTTNLVRNWSTTFHYTYPEFADSNGSPAAINSYINKLYGPSATATAGSSKRTVEVLADADIVPRAAFAEPTAAPSPAPEPEFAPVLSERAANGRLASNGSSYQYVANIKTSRYSLDGSYNIYLFLGNPTSENPASWVLDRNLIGTQGIFSQPGMDMTNMDPNVVVSGSIPLTRALTAKLSGGLLGSLAETVVAPFLAQALEWRIQGPDGSSVDPNTVPSFEVSVIASTSTQPASAAELPVWSVPTVLETVTHGKPGGLNASAS